MSGDKWHIVRSSNGVRSRSNSHTTQELDGLETGQHAHASSHSSHTSPQRDRERDLGPHISHAHPSHSHSHQQHSHHHNTHSHSAHSSHAHSPSPHHVLTPVIDDNTPVTTPSHSPMNTPIEEITSGSHLIHHATSAHARHAYPTHSSHSSSSHAHSTIHGNGKSPPRTSSISNGTSGTVLPLSTEYKSHPNLHAIDQEDSSSEDENRSRYSLLHSSPPSSTTTWRHRFLSSSSTFPPTRFINRTVGVLLAKPTNSRTRLLRRTLILLGLTLLTLFTVDACTLFLRFYHYYFSTICEGISMPRFNLPMSDPRHPSHCPAAFDSEKTQEVFTSLTPEMTEGEDGLRREMTRIPNYIHYIYDVHEPIYVEDEEVPSGSTDEFSILYYLSIASAYHIQKAERVYVHHYGTKPQGQWWDASVKLLGTKLIVKEEASFDTIFGHPLYHPLLKSDITRLEILKKYGGIYMDLDMIIIKPLHQFLSYRLVLSEEHLDSGLMNRLSYTLSEGIGDTYSRIRGVVGMSNKIILSHARHDFIAEWYEQYRTFNYLEWDQHSSKVPLLLAQKHTEQVLSIHADLFTQPHYNQLEKFLYSNSFDFRSSYVIHTWSHFIHERLPLGTIKRVEQLWQHDTSFARMAKAVLNSTYWKV